MRDDDEAGLTVRSGQMTKRLRDAEDSMSNGNAGTVGEGEVAQTMMRFRRCER
jgi:hypothetical protein